MAAQMGLTTFTVAIASGQSLSSQIDIGPYCGEKVCDC